MERCALLLELDDARDASDLFDRLSAGGRVTVRLALQPWGDHHGNFTDGFGVPWAVRFAAAHHSVGA